MVPVTAARPPGEGNGTLCKVASAPFGLCATVGASKQALRAPRFSVACGHAMGVCPAHPWASSRCACLGPALACPSAPKGLPQPSARPFARRWRAAQLQHRRHPRRCHTPKIVLHLPLHRVEIQKPRYRLDSRVFNVCLGWLMGLEPTTTGITILDSTN